MIVEFLPAIRFNGKSAVENGENFRRFVPTPGNDAGAGRTFDELVAFDPQIIILDCDDACAETMLGLESRWPGPSPFFIPGYTFAPYVLDFIGTNPERRHRFFSVTNVSSTSTNINLVLRYNQAYPDAPVTPTSAPQPSYDAFYMLAYATYALGDAPITGPALSRAFERLLPPGRPIDVGPAGIYDAFQTLRTGGHIDLNGAIGSLDFDPATGEAPIDYSILCPGVDDHGRATAAIESGLVYDAHTKKVTGTNRCP